MMAEEVEEVEEVVEVVVGVEVEVLELHILHLEQNHSVQIKGNCSVHDMFTTKKMHNSFELKSYIVKYCTGTQKQNLQR